MTYKEFIKPIIDELKSEMQRQGFTVKRLSKCCSINEATIEKAFYQYEVRNVSKLYQIADALGFEIHTVSKDE